jgi:hypothetical protein
MITRQAVFSLAHLDLQPAEKDFPAQPKRERIPSLNDATRIFLMKKGER